MRGYCCGGIELERGWGSNSIGGMVGGGSARDIRGMGRVYSDPESVGGRGELWGISIGER